MISVKSILSHLHERAYGSIYVAHYIHVVNGHAYAPPPDYRDAPPTILNTPVTPELTTVPPCQEGDWWTQTKLWYRQQWKKTDPVLPAVSASLGLAVTAASLAGNLTGAGMVMVPFAFVWIVFSAGLLESCCEMLEERHEEYRRFHWYTQYSDIANRAVGPGLSCGVVNTPVAVVLTILLLTGIAGNNKMATGTGEAMFTIKLFDLGSLIGDVSGLSKGVKDVTSALYFVSLGILAFNFAGVCEFTNIRRDMKAPPSFTKAAAFGVAGLAWRRARISAPLALCAGGIALALPYEGPLMGLVGSLALCPVAFLLPPVFYYKLCQGSEQWPEKSVTKAVHSTLTSFYFKVNAMMPDQTWYVIVGIGGGRTSDAKVYDAVSTLYDVLPRKDVVT
ncbi:hypothetical protein HPB51_029151 [Rhipicephalus microplus]|uniref:Amino acid transporter transmembrane domain-containing protein n=1 Tax=Rhipicephalus microplus TaxID=6941 RepID=A0A9J6CV19_RHIMP|nr:hypothetical protein HPB51_029151 [Rhipicephalus microplus]